MAALDDWTCEYRGLVMGAPDSAISIVAVDGLLSLPDVRTADLTLIQRDGVLAGEDYLGGRTVTVTLEVYGRDREEFTSALNDLQVALTAGGAEEFPFRFRFPGAAADQTAYVMARVRRRSAPLDLNFAYMTCNLAFEVFATSPLITGDAPRSVAVRSLKRSVVPSGFVPPALVPWQIRSQGSAEVDPVSRFTQYGSVPARPTIEIRDAAHPVLVDDVTGQWFGVAYDGAMFVDSVAQTVQSAAGDDLTGLVTVGSTWPALVAGEHRMRLRSRDEYTAGTAVLTWSDRWV
ncbi:hypothetical protein ABZV65_04190 [Streptomyces bauhiniae]|uniref:hypothetical protein n=1 Tax=Streptomyces bauhiniae TaxID=2340725 RepID=UPI0033AA60BE